jgi:hypothetical protein
MAPEQARGRPVQASDLWSLGATLYSAVEGRLLYTGSPTEILVALLDPGRPVPAPRQTDPLAGVLSVLLDKEAARRPAATAVAHQLHEIRTHPPIPPTTMTAPPGPTPDPPRLPPYYHHLLAAGGLDGTLRLWDPWTGQSVGEPPADDHEQILATAFSPDGALLAFGGTGGGVRLWNSRARQLVGEPLTGYSGDIAALAFSPDGFLLATAGSGRTVWLWDVRTRQPLCRRLVGHAGTIRELAFSPDGTVLAGVSADRGVLAATSGNAAVWLWDVRNTPR